MGGLGGSWGGVRVIEVDSGVDCRLDAVADGLAGGAGAGCVVVGFGWKPLPGGG